MNRIAINITIAILFFTGITKAQHFQTKELLCDTCEGDLNLLVESSSFTKNNEYLSPFAQGITGIGVQVKPTLEYYLNKNTKANIGAYALKYSGVNNLSQVTPIFSIHHKICKGAEVVFGNIYGNLNHELEEPLYRFDRYYTNNIEYGFQFLHQSKYIETDLWVDWDKFIFEGDPFQEEFTAGNHTKLKVYNSDKFEFTADIQALLSHKGGEIDTYEGPAIYIFNGAYGFDVRYKTEKFSFGLSPKALWYRGLRMPVSGNNFHHYKHGNGLLVKADVDHKYFNFKLGYWHGEKFIGSKGEYLYMSVSETNDKLKQDTRKIITAKLSVKRPISKNLHLELRTELYSDLVNDILPDYTYGFYFIANERFFLKKIKKRK